MDPLIMVMVLLLIYVIAYLISKPPPSDWSPKAPSRRLRFSMPLPATTVLGSTVALGEARAGPRHQGWFNQENAGFTKKKLRVSPTDTVSISVYTICLVVYDGMVQMGVQRNYKNWN
jgi:hypothetical protein